MGEGGGERDIVNSLRPAREGGGVVSGTKKIYFFLLSLPSPINSHTAAVAGRNDFDVGNIHFEGHWKGWTLKIAATGTAAPTAAGLAVPARPTVHRYTNTVYYFFTVAVDRQADLALKTVRSYKRDSKNRADIKLECLLEWRYVQTSDTNETRGYQVYIYILR
jgi:hypothetical protein